MEASGRSGRRRPKRDLRVGNLEEARAFSPTAVRRTVNAVLDGERAGPAAISITFLSAGKMRALNRRTFGEDRATDVIAFGLSHVDSLVGDIYICPSAARRAVREHGVTEREEITRLVIHGVLHVLGYEHPDGAPRGATAMWKRQERYLRALRARRQR